MSYLKLLLSIAFIVVILYFGFLNGDERVTVHLSPAQSGEFRDVPLSLVLFLSYLAGMVTFAVASLFRDLKNRMHIMGLHRENRKLRDELHQLRSVSLDDLPVQDEGDGEW